MLAQVARACLEGVSPGLAASAISKRFFAAAANDKKITVEVGPGLGALGGR